MTGWPVGVHAATLLPTAPATPTPLPATAVGNESTHAPVQVFAAGASFAVMQGTRGVWMPGMRDALNGRRAYHNNSSFLLNSTGTPFGDGVQEAEFKGWASDDQRTRWVTNQVGIGVLISLTGLLVLCGLCGFLNCCRDSWKQARQAATGEYDDEKEEDIVVRT